MCRASQYICNEQRRWVHCPNQIKLGRDFGPLRLTVCIRANVREHTVCHPDRELAYIVRPADDATTYMLKKSTSFSNFTISKCWRYPC
jgi:hypothetical protein